MRTSTLNLLRTIVLFAKFTPKREQVLTLFASRNPPCMQTDEVSISLLLSCPRLSPFLPSSYAYRYSGTKYVQADSIAIFYYQVGFTPSWIPGVIAAVSPSAGSTTTAFSKSVEVFSQQMPSAIPIDSHIVQILVPVLQLSLNAVQVQFLTCSSLLSSVLV